MRSCQRMIFKNSVKAKSAYDVTFDGRLRDSVELKVSPAYPVTGTLLLDSSILPIGLPDSRTAVAPSLVPNCGYSFINVNRPLRAADATL